MMEEKKQPDVLCKWEAPSRPFKRRDKSFFQTIAAMVFLIVVILFFIREWLIIGTSLAVVFVAYALAAVPPINLKYQITEKGVWVGEVFYHFSELTEYWFENFLENRVLVILIPTRRIGRLMLVVPTGKESEIDGILRKKLVYREKPLKTFMDSTADWLKKKVPLEEENAHT